jgi:hypothetical protein
MTNAVRAPKVSTAMARVTVNVAAAVVGVAGAAIVAKVVTVARGRKANRAAGPSKARA